MTDKTKIELTEWQRLFLAAASNANFAAGDMVEAVRDQDTFAGDNLGSGDCLVSLVDAVRMLIEGTRMIDASLPGGDPADTEELLTAILKWQGQQP